MSGADVRPDDPLLLACRALSHAMDLFDEAACRALGIGRSDLRALNLLEHGPFRPLPSPTPSTCPAPPSPPCWTDSSAPASWPGTEQPPRPARHPGRPPA